MAIVDNYITLLRAYNIRSAAAFCERFYQRITKARFDEILKTYCIVPEQHKDKYVVEALEQMKAGEEIPQEEREDPPRSRAPACPVMILDDGRVEYMWPENLAIAPDMIKLIDEHINRTPASDPQRLRFLRRRREKFERVLKYYDDLSHSS